MSTKYLTGILIMVLLLSTGCMNSYESCKADCVHLCVEKESQGNVCGTIDCIFEDFGCNDKCASECR